MIKSSLSLTDLDGSNGFRIVYSRNSFVFDTEPPVSSAGDVNGDGIADLIIGDASAGGGGESYIVFGTDNGFGRYLGLAGLDGSNGFRLDGAGQFDFSGWSVSSAGDVNSDGFDDVIVGAPSAFGAPSASTDGRGRAGESYVVFGADGGFAASLSLADLDGINGFRLDGIDEDGFSGTSVSSAGDVNGDGIDDVIIGAASASPDGEGFAGESYVAFGSEGGFAPSLSLAALDGSNGFRLDGIDANDRSGFSVSSAGDVNGDGIDDVIIGAYRADPEGNRYAGESYVVFGSDNGFDASLSLADLDGSNGFRLVG